LARGCNFTVVITTPTSLCESPFSSQLLLVLQGYEVYPRFILEYEDIKYLHGKSLLFKMESGSEFVRSDCNM
jgi:hypothetical protein